MTHKESKAPSLSSDEQDEKLSHINNSPRKPRTREDFYKFCTYILEYENYERQRPEEENRTSTRTPPPLDSSGSSVNSESATSSGQEEDKPSEDDTDAEPEQDTENNEDSYDLVTCYCRKPFAGRPMIECSNCLTWVHLSCARIRRTHIPDVFYCTLCKHNKLRPVRSDTTHPTNRTVATTGMGQTTTTGMGMGTTTTMTMTMTTASPPDSPAMKRMKRGASF